MKSLHIREIPDQTLQNLKQRAARHHRSLQQEVRWLLEIAAARIPPEQPDRLDLIFSQQQDTSPASTWSREQIYDEDGR